VLGQGDRLARETTPLPHGLGYDSRLKRLQLVLALAEGRNGAHRERAAHRASGLYGKIDAENINKAMETFNNEDFGGLVPYVTYAKDNHEGSFKGRIVKINEDATYEPMTAFYVPGKEKHLFHLSGGYEQHSQA
jgi:hypothetical protein